MIDKMSDSMIAAATCPESETESFQASSGVSSEVASDFSSVSSSCQPPSDVSSHGTLENTTSGASSMEQTVRCEDVQQQGAPKTLDLVTCGMTDNDANGGVSPVPMETTPTQGMDLLGALNGHATNGIENSNDMQKQQQQPSR